MNKFFTAFLFIIITLAPTLGNCFWGKKDHLQRYLKEMAIETNKSLPLMTDEYTLATNLTAKKRSLTYTNKLINITRSQIDIAVTESNLSIAIKEEICRNPDTRKLIDMGVIYNHIFNDQNNEYMFKIKTNKSDCE